MTPPLRVFIGYDSQEPITFAVAMHSLLTRCSQPISVTPLRQDTLRAAGLYWRERNPTESTEFSLTRFLVPALSNYEGFSLFLDSDVLVRCDVLELMQYAARDPYKALYCVQHDYTPKDGLKFDGHVQTAYPRKNWSSVMLFRNEECQGLQPEYVNGASGLELHRFLWLEGAVGSLPLDYNWLVGEYAPNPDAKILHYTLGAPCFAAYRDCDHADLWWEAYADMERPNLPLEPGINSWRDRYGNLHYPERRPSPQLQRTRDLLRQVAERDALGRGLAELRTAPVHEALKPILEPE